MSYDEDVEVVPLLWVSALLTEKFWTTEVAKHGCKALIMPRFVKVARHFSKTGASTKSITAAKALLEVDTPLDSLKERLRTTALDFNRRVHSWVGRRPWYQEEKFKWFISPWKTETWRPAIKQFKIAHALKYQVEC
ncbi:hypothetical protein PG994_013562 [Apiospora phragmitis]|uniref:Uncharacterized protein n=1 Tax=Apiospora phragmitis TaxID=2905665 RepID=A0ABR1T8Z7_9PEZI